MRSREEEILLATVNSRATDALPLHFSYPYDVIKALAQVCLEQEKRIQELEVVVLGA